MGFHITCWTTIQQIMLFQLQESALSTEETAMYVICYSYINALCFVTFPKSPEPILPAWTPIQRRMLFQESALSLSAEEMPDLCLYIIHILLFLCSLQKSFSLKQQVVPRIESRCTGSV